MVHFVLESTNPILWRDGRKILGKWAITGISIVMQIGGGQFQKRISAPTSWYLNPCDTSIFLHARSNFRKKNGKTQFSGQNLTFLRVLPSQNIRAYSNMFYITKRLWLETKILLKNLHSFWSYLEKPEGVKMTPSH